MKNKMNRTDVSVIIVNYKVREELFDCIDSIVKSKPKVGFEIIVVDNDKESEIKKELTNKFPEVKYIKSPRNVGFGAGNNLGSKIAKGKYLFFLNPDTKVFKGTLDNLHKYLNENSKVGMISPVFLNLDLTPFESQGSEELTPKITIFSMSFLRKIFPKKNIYKNNLNSWDMKKQKSVDVVPGAAMMISAKLFEKIGGFDEKFFLYFEENDISKRVKNLGLKLFIIPSSRIIHLIGKSTKNLKNMEEIYSESRFYYLKKHYGILKAIFVNLVLSINKNFLFLFLILVAGFILRILNIENTMPFIGDQGWFYLSARDMVINGQIPLVGIASSHPWLHQGPLWTYLLAGIFWVFGFNPLNGAYLAIILGLITVWSVYVVGKEFFSSGIGLISALLYATSPLAIIYSRTPYHTSPIPLFTLLFILCLHKWLKGNPVFFPLSIFLLATLYNFELATVMLWFVLLAILSYGIWKKKEWIKNLLNKTTIFLSALALLIPMTPILINDFNHNFPQTIKFTAWIGYKIIGFFGFPNIHGENTSTGLSSMLAFFFHFYQNLIFAPNNTIAFIILLVSFGILFINIYKSFKKKIHEIGFWLLALWILIPLAGYFVNRTSSEAYLPIFFPALIILTAFSFDQLLKKQILSIFTVLLIVFIALVNSYSAVLSDYSTSSFSYSKRLSVAKEIIKKADGRNYNIIGRGPGSEFASFMMNYEYLVWWLGNAPSKAPQKLKFVVRENNNQVFLNANE